MAARKKRPAPSSSSAKKAGPARAGEAKGKGLEKLLAKHGITDFKWIDPKTIVVSHWVRMKCMFGCNEYGRTATCPPHVPSLEECRKFFRDYKRAIIIHYQKTVAKPEDRHEWTRKTNLSLVELEREVFLSGWEKAFLLFMDSCTICAQCTGKRETCLDPRKARPTPEAMAVDVFATVRKAGYPIQVLASTDEPMNRYAFLLLD